MAVEVGPFRVAKALFLVHGRIKIACVASVKLQGEHAQAHAGLRSDGGDSYRSRYLVLQDGVCIGLGGLSHAAPKVLCAAAGHFGNLLPRGVVGLAIAAEDEWAKSGIASDRDFAAVFSKHFYFGCEADDRAVAGAFNAKANPFNARLNAIFSSDVGHWDVPDISGVLGEAYELVDDGLIDEADFRDFVFTNTVRLHTKNNRDFFKGTAAEGAVNDFLAADTQSQAAE